jgi:hypothetical protein
MKVLNISIDEKIYTVEHIIPTINIYKITHPKGFLEVTRNRNNGKWKILSKTNPSIRIPLKPIGKAIEENLTIIN